jgi:hypothetical protein
MAAVFLAVCIQDSSGIFHIALRDTKFQLSVISSADVSGMGGVVGKIPAGGSVFPVDILQQAFPFDSEERNIFLYWGFDRKRSAASTHKGTVF